MLGVLVPAFPLHAEQPHRSIRLNHLSVDEVLRLAGELIDAGRHEEAEGLLDRLARDRVGGVERDFLDGMAALAGKDFARAERLFRKILEGDPKLIRVRLEHWFAAIEQALKDLGFTGPIARRLVLTGGGAELKGIADYAQGVLGRSVRVGRPRGLIGMPEAHSGMSFATLSGLVLYAASDPIDLGPPPGPQQVVRMSPTGMVQRLIAAVRSGY